MSLWFEFLVLLGLGAGLLAATSAVGTLNSICFALNRVATELATANRHDQERQRAERTSS